MIALAALLLVACAATPSGAADGFDDALAFAAQGQFVEAVRAAETLEDPVRRAQAMVWTHQQAGDWVGADRIARVALESSNDPWLAERRAEIALTLGRSDLSPARLKAWEDALSSASQPRAERESALERLGQMADQSAEVRVARELRERGISRAKRTVIGGLLGFVLAAGWLLRRSC